MTNYFLALKLSLISLPEIEKINSFDVIQLFSNELLKKLIIENIFTPIKSPVILKRFNSF